MNPIERMYKGKCTVTEMKKITDPVTKITKQTPVIVFENQPCKLSFSSVKSTDTNNGAANVTLTPKLFISPSIEIKAGSKITVHQDGKEYELSKSGIPAVYPTHQEIVLELFTKYA